MTTLAGDPEVMARGKNLPRYGTPTSNTEPTRAVKEFREHHDAYIRVRDGSANVYTPGGLCESYAAAAIRALDDLFRKNVEVLLRDDEGGETVLWCVAEARNVVNEGLLRRWLAAHPLDDCLVGANDSLVDDTRAALDKLDEPRDPFAARPSLDDIGAT